MRPPLRAMRRHSASARAWKIRRFSRSSSAPTRLAGRRAVGLRSTRRMRDDTAQAKRNVHRDAEDEAAVDQQEDPHHGKADHESDAREDRPPVFFSRRSKS